MCCCCAGVIEAKYSLLIVGTERASMISNFLLNCFAHRPCLYELNGKPYGALKGEGRTKPTSQTPYSFSVKHVRFIPRYEAGKYIFCLMDWTKIIFMVSVGLHQAR